MRRALAGLLLFIATFVTTNASAAEPTSEAPKTETRWYGYQTLAADAVTIAAFVSSASADNETGTKLAAGAYVLTSPIIHAIHGHFGRAGLSLGLRVGAPIVGAYAGMVFGAAAGRGDEGWGNLVLGGLVGFSLGVLVGPIVDAAIGHDKVEVTPQTGLRVMPVIAPNHVGLTGTF